MIQHVSQQESVALQGEAGSFKESGRGAEKKTCGLSEEIRPGAVDPVHHRGSTRLNKKKRPAFQRQCEAGEPRLRSTCSLKSH